MLFDIIFFGTAFLVIFVSYYFLFMKKKQKKVKRQITENSQQQQNNDQIVENNNQEIQDDGDSDQNSEDENQLQKTKKQLYRDAKKQEKKQQYQARQHGISEQAKKDEKRRLIQEEKDLEREMEEEEIEKEKERLKEEAKLKEEEEFSKWKDMFQIDETGNKATDEQEEGNMLQRFIDYIKTHKVMLLEDLGNEFMLNTQETVNRIKSLEDNGQLNGVIDDRGKYIYLEQKELQSIANYIKTKGHVSKTELIMECNRIIKIDTEQQVGEDDKQMLAQMEQALEAEQQ